jgi:hypothetical protein
VTRRTWAGKSLDPSGSAADRWWTAQNSYFLNFAKAGAPRPPPPYCCPYPCPYCTLPLFRSPPQFAPSPLPVLVPAGQPPPPPPPTVPPPRPLPVRRRGQRK